MEKKIRFQFVYLIADEQNFADLECQKVCLIFFFFIHRKFNVLKSQLIKHKIKIFSLHYLILNFRPRSNTFTVATSQFADRNVKFPIYPARATFFVSSSHLRRIVRAVSWQRWNYYSTEKVLAAVTTEKCTVWYAHWTVHNTSQVRRQTLETVNYKIEAEKSMTFKGVKGSSQTDKDNMNMVHICFFHNHFSKDTLSYFQPSYGSPFAQHRIYRCSLLFRMDSGETCAGKDLAFRIFNKNEIRWRNFHVRVLCILVAEKISYTFYKI